MVYLWPFPYFAYFVLWYVLPPNMYLMSWALTYSKELIGVIKLNCFSDVAGLWNQTMITATLLFLMQ